MGKGFRYYKTRNGWNKFWYLGKTVKVLINGHSDKGENMYSGYTESMKLVNVKSNEDIIGQIVDVKITDAKSFSLDGELWVLVE